MEPDIDYQPTRILMDEAIQNRYAITIHYMSDAGRVETFRRVTPFCMGRYTIKDQRNILNGVTFTYVRVQHLTGQSFSSGRAIGVQRLFRFDRILDMNQALGITFNQPNPPGYNQNDEFFDSIISRV